jgi:hypothetical protein
MLRSVLHSFLFFFFFCLFICFVCLLIKWWGVGLGPAVGMLKDVRLIPAVAVS